MGMGRTALELRVGLGGHEERVAAALQLDELHQGAVGRGTADVQPGGLETVPVGVVDLVTMAVSLRHGRRAVQAGHQGVLVEFGRVGSQPHRSSEITLALDDVDLLRHRRDDGIGAVRIELAGGSSLDPHQVLGRLDDCTLQSEAQPQEGDPLLSGVTNGSDLALDTADTEPAGYTDTVHVTQVLSRPLRGGAGVGGNPLDVDLDAVGVSSGAQRLGHREVGIGQIDVFADQGDRHLAGGLLHPFEQVVPGGPVDVTEEQVEFLDDVGVQPLTVQDLGNEVDRGGVRARDHGRGVDVAHEGDLVLDALDQRAFRTADDGIGLDADLTQGGDRVLGRLGLHLPGRLDVGHQ